MRWLTRPRHDEQGAVIVLMMVVIVVILGMAALVVDIGALLDEKRQLQNGADAGALAVAQSCRLPGPTCDDALATPLAKDNSRDGDSSAFVSHTPGYVTVETRTGNGSSDVVPFQFGRALTGDKGKPIKATAVARWGGIKRTSVIPLTISKCEFDAATTNNTVFGKPVTVLFKTKVPPCPGSSGDLPGGFGWVKDATPNDCTITPSADSTVLDDTGIRGTPNGCNLPSLLVKDVSLVVYDRVTCCGAGGTYHIYGFANFQVTGYQFASDRGGTVSCASGESCLAGYFVRSVGTGEYGGPSLAGNLVTLIS